MKGGQLSVRSKLLGGAAALGGGAILIGVGIYLYSRLEQEKLNSSHRKVSRESKRSSITEYKTEEKKSDDEEEEEEEEEEEMFYDVNSTVEREVFHDVDLEEESEEVFHDVNSNNEENKSIEEELFQKADELMEGNDEDRLNAYNLLNKHEFEMSENSDFLWRYVKAHYIQASACKDSDANKKKIISSGLKFAERALKLDDTNPNVHKWFAILIGMEATYLPLHKKIKSGEVYYKHLLIAMEKKPEDYALHHLLGRFKYELAKLSKIEKKIAESILGQNFNANYEDCIRDFLEAEKLSPKPWKRNGLMLAMCYERSKKYDEAIEWLDSAIKIKPKIKDDEECDLTIESLRKKYHKYRR